MDKAKVYFVKLDDIGRLKELLPQFKGKLGMKVHFGEKGANMRVPAEYFREIASLADFPTLVETSVLYRSERSQAQSHKQLARRHGFDFAPIDIIDGETGDDYDTVAAEKDGHFKEYYLGKNLANYDSLLVVSHFKGHIAAGFGGAIKNLSMGLAARRGKLAMHASVKHSVNPEKCIACGICIANCPVNAIAYGADGKALIDQNICIGCSKCIALCPEMAIGIPFGTTDKPVFNERLAEYALAAIGQRQGYYINILMNISPYCDCFIQHQEKLTPDIGILASADPVAVDQASYDLVAGQCDHFKNEKDGQIQMEYGEKIGLGSREYEMLGL